MMPLVLSLFPGIGLLDMAFEEEGFCVVRGPDVLWGGDIRRFHPMAGKFDGVIGGPPCQIHSNASAICGTNAVDLIPEFIRCVDEAKPAWLVMENVPQALDHPDIPQSWNPVILNDHDCGGETARTRAFWMWPMMMLSPGRVGRAPSKSVMASTWKRGKSGSQYVSDKGFLPGDLAIEEYGRLQGCQPLAEQLRDHPSKPSRSFIVHVLGNGVPLSMGRYVARAVKAAIGMEAAA
jgi:DNA (cytosine-5)-methyltransferase 1